MVHRPEVHAMPDPPLLPMASRLLAQLPGLRADPQMALLGELKALPPDDAAEVALQILEHMDESTGVLAGMTCASPSSSRIRRNCGVAMKLVRASVKCSGERRMPFTRSRR